MTNRQIIRALEERIRSLETLAMVRKELMTVWMDQAERLQDELAKCRDKCRALENCNDLNDEAAAKRRNFKIIEFEGGLN